MAKPATDDDGASSDRPRRAAKYMEITDTLRGELRDLPRGEQLEPERELIKRFGVSRMTLRQALDQLESSGYIERVPGRGTFVGRPTITMGPTPQSFTQDMTSRGLVPSARLLSFELAPATPDVLEALDLPDGSTAVRMERLRFADGEPMCIEVAQLPPRFLGLLESADLESSLHVILAADGVTVAAQSRRVRAAAAQHREAVLLGLGLGTPVLEVSDVYYDARGRPVQLARSSYRHDRYEIVTGIQRAPEPRPE